MNLRFLSLTTLLAASMFAAAGARAHDPSLHEVPPQKTKPMTCEELADTQRFSAEMANNDLRSKCEAEAREAEKGDEDENANADPDGE